MKTTLLKQTPNSVQSKSRLDEQPQKDPRFIKAGQMIHENGQMIEATQNQKTNLISKPLRPLPTPPKTQNPPPRPPRKDLLENPPSPLPRDVDTPSPIPASAPPIPEREASYVEGVGTFTMILPGSRPNELLEAGFEEIPGDVELVSTSYVPEKRYTEMGKINTNEDEDFVVVPDTQPLPYSRKKGTALIAFQKTLDQVPGMSVQQLEKAIVFFRKHDLPDKEGARAVTLALITKLSNPLKMTTDERTAAKELALKLMQTTPEPLLKKLEMALSFCLSHG